MSQTLSKGYKLPETGDRGFWTDLEFDITRINSHDHDGTDSTLISPKNLDKSTANISSASWAAVAGQTGTYKQTITVPTGYAVNTMQVKFYTDPAGEEVLLSVKKASATTYDLYINDNSLDLVAVYG